METDLSRVPSSVCHFVERERSALQRGMLGNGEAAPGVFMRTPRHASSEETAASFAVYGCNKHAAILVMVALSLSRMYILPLQDFSTS
jgi:hypothetical protein